MDLMTLAAAKALSGGGGGSDLPSVTAEDNGDVLTVVEGAWAKASPSGGGGCMKITASEVEGSVVLDKNYSEISEAFDSGVFPYILYDMGSGAMMPMLITSYFVDEGIYAVTTNVETNFEASSATGVLTASE